MSVYVDPLFDHEKRIEEESARAAESSVPCPHNQSGAKRRRWS